MQGNDELCELTSRTTVGGNNEFKVAVTLVAQHTWMKKLALHLADIHDRMEGLAEHFAAADAVIEAALDEHLDDELAE